MILSDLLWGLSVISAVVGLNVVAHQRDKARDRYDRLFAALASEVNYCFTYADKYAETDPERSARHRERGERLLKALEEPK